MLGYGLIAWACMCVCVEMMMMMGVHACTYTRLRICVLRAAQFGWHWYYESFPPKLVAENMAVFLSPPPFFFSNPPQTIPFCHGI